MSRMFCTFQEAAATLHTGEDQINALVDQGLLREFRQGPHRLVRQADIDALELLRPGPAATLPAPPAAPAAVLPRRSPARHRARTKARRPAPPKTAARGTTAPKRAKVPQTRSGRGRTEDRGYRIEERRPRLDDSDILRPPACLARPAAPLRPPPAASLPTPPAPSVRQWFWMGLIQDRPLAIALLAGLVLVGLSALAAGLCVLAEGL